MNIVESDSVPVLTKETQSCDQSRALHGACGCVSAMSATELCSSPFNVRRWGVRLMFILLLKLITDAFRTEKTMQNVFKTVFNAFESFSSDQLV